MELTKKDIEKLKKQKDNAAKNGKIVRKDGKARDTRIQNA